MSVAAASSPPVKVWSFDTHSMCEPTGDPLVWRWSPVAAAYNSPKSVVGGFTASVMLRTGYRALLRQFLIQPKRPLTAAGAGDLSPPPEFSYPHPLSVRVHYLKIVESGAASTATITVTVMKTSKQSASVQIVLSQHNEARVVALAMYGNLNSRPTEGWNWSNPNHSAPAVLSGISPYDANVMPFGEVIPNPGGGPLSSVHDKIRAWVNPRNGSDVGTTRRTETDRSMDDCTRR